MAVSPARNAWVPSASLACRVAMAVALELCASVQTAFVSSAAAAEVVELGVAGLLAQAAAPPRATATIAVMIKSLRMTLL